MTRQHLDGQNKFMLKIRLYSFIVLLGEAGLAKLSLFGPVLADFDVRSAALLSRSKKRAESVTSSVAATFAMF